MATHLHGKRRRRPPASKGRDRQDGEVVRAENARQVAASVLLRVCSQGAFAMRALDAELARARLSPRDRALATEIVYGSLRVLPELDARLSPRLRRGIAETDGLTLAVLRVAVYQLWHLGKIPAHAVVDEAVGFIRRARSRQSAGFVNAVLRALAQERPEAPEPAFRVVMPEWLVTSLQCSLGEQRAGCMMEPRNAPPPLCVATAAERREELRAALVASLAIEDSGAEVVDGALSPLALCLRRAGDLRRLPLFDDGAFWIQEEGAQLVALAVDPQPGEALADVCAGHGGKTLCLSAIRNGQGPITAIDVDESKLDRLAEEYRRVGLPAEGLSCEAVDLTVGVGGLPPAFDRVLVDAPCSGLGTVLRRPELLLRLSPDDPGRFGQLQRQIVGHALQLVKPGGELFVAVCSPLEEEGAALAKSLEADFPQLKRRAASVDRLSLKADEDLILRIGPWLAQGQSVPDAYQVLRFQVDSSPELG